MYHVSISEPEREQKTKKRTEYPMSRTFMKCTVEYNDAPFKNVWTTLFYHTLDAWLGPRAYHIPKRKQNQTL